MNKKTTSQRQMNKQKQANNSEANGKETTKSGFI